MPLKITCKLQKYRSALENKEIAFKKHSMLSLDLRTRYSSNKIVEIPKLFRFLDLEQDNETIKMVKKYLLIRGITFSSPNKNFHSIFH